jgi:5'-3' exonuclease
MGIPFYFYNLYKRYTNDKVLVDENFVQSITFNYLFFDYNSLIHPCAQRVIKKSREEQLDLDLDKTIISECLAYTRYVMSVIRAEKVYIMVDGVAPRAKVNQQRERRYKSLIMKELQNEKVIWDSNKITPGTSFMHKLKLELDNFAQDMGKMGCSVFVSGAQEVGEGEHKMMRVISNLPINDDKRICIYGLDADLIMLSMMSKKSDDIILLRDNSGDDHTKPYMYLEVASLKRAIVQELLSKIGISLCGDRLIRDYIFLCCLLGNDFLGHLPSVTMKDNGISLLISVYVKYMKGLNRGYLTDGIELNFELFFNIIREIANSEEYFFKNVYTPYTNYNSNGQRILYKDTVPLDKLTSPSPLQPTNFVTRCYIDDMIKYNIKGYKERYYTFYGISDINDACYNYLQGLLWVLLYYTPSDTMCQNWGWFYKYHATPFASDFFAFLKVQGKDILDKCKQVVNENTQPLSTMQQLLLVLPEKSLTDVMEETNKTLLSNLERILRTESNSVRYLFPKTVILDMIHKEYLWQGKLLMSHSDLTQLKLLFEESC